MRPEKDEPRAAPLTAERGRTDGLSALRQLLVSAPPPYLDGALRNPETAEEEVILLLRNRSATPALLRRIGRDRRWTRSYDVKKGLVRHPKTPLPIARNMIHHLYWRDLAETADDGRVHPAVRRQSEELLRVRLAEMTVGERISLARMASRGLIPTLCDTGEERVIEALLGNGKLVETDAVGIASGEAVPGAVLSLLARHPTWGERHAVRLALVGNPRTPVPVALRVLGRLPGADLDRLAGDRRVPKIVRMGADRRLQRAAERGGKKKRPRE